MASPEDRPGPRAAAAMRHAEGLVQMKKANARADITRPAETHLRVHVGAIHIDLPAVLMNDFANIADGLFEDAMSGRISDHEGGEALAMRFGFGFEIGETDVALLVAGHGHDLH